MNYYSKHYRIINLYQANRIIGYRSTAKKALALAEQHAERWSASIRIEKRSARGTYEYYTIWLNPEKFSTA